MNFKKQFIFLLALVLLFSVLYVPAFAAETPQFRYELTVDGKDIVEVNTGDIITITLYLYRTDAESPYTMYAMQDEIRYDSNFFELVEDSAHLYEGVHSTDIAMVDHHREFYMNYVSLSGGVQWNSKTRIGSFQLKVTGTSGVTTITNQDFLVSLPDGSDSYICEANELTVILTTDCTVKFETNGGTKIDPITAIYGETITRPEDPSREGKHLVGWYKDIHLTEEWNFEADTVKGNMTLYAKWEPVAVPPVTSDDPAEPSDPVDPTDPIEPPEPAPKNDSLMLAGALVVAIGLILFFLLLWKQRLVQYSLVTGDVSLSFKNGSLPAEVSVVLYDGEKEYHLNKSGTVEVRHRLRFIKNVTNLTIADIQPGTYKGKLLIDEGGQIKIQKCRIKALDRELQETFRT